MTETTKKRLTPAEKAKANPKSAKLAIAAFCYHACLGETAPNSHLTKGRIRDCQSQTCPLWPHRGWQNLGIRANAKDRPKTP
jgi:hypothetical protein